MNNSAPSHWFYAGPYVPSGVIYDSDKSIKHAPSYSVWLVPGYEQAFEAFGVIDLYNPPKWFMESANVHIRD